MSNVFTGPEAVRDYLDMSKHAPTSCVELPSELTEVPKSEVRMFLKMMGAESPLNNFKIIPVQRWFAEQKKLGKLTPKITVVINSSGCAGLASAVCARAYGTRIIVIMPADAPDDKQKLVRREIGDNGELILSREEPGKPTGVEMARMLGKRKNHLVFDQYGDDINWKAHSEVTIHQIFGQMDEAGLEVGAVVVAMGTTGTLLGARDYCKKHSPHTAIVGVMAEEGEPIPAVRTESRLGPTQILFDWKTGTVQIKVARYESYKKTVQAFQHGFKVGLSTGAALVGAARFVKNASVDLRGKAVVVVSGDILDPYLDQLRVILDPKDL